MNFSSVHAVEGKSRLQRFALDRPTN